MNTIKLSEKTAKIIAHRGVSALECENTCAAFVAAGNRSYYGIETDVHLTADGKFAIIHDFETGRVSPHNLPVEQTDFDQLAAICLYDPQSMQQKLTRSDLRIPALEEYIRICRYYRKQAVLEIKTNMNTQQIQSLIDVIADLDYLESTTFISFGFDNVKQIRLLLPQQSVQFLTGEWNAEQIDQLAGLHIGLDIHFGALTKKRVDYAHNQGLEVNCWTVDDPEIANQLMDWGVDYITSNILE